MARKTYEEKAREYEVFSISQELRKAGAKKRNKAVLMVGTAVRSGVMSRGCCSVCGIPETQGHHEDYDKPLDVIWLCKVHHQERHREINAAIGSARKRYNEIAELLMVKREKQAISMAKRSKLAKWPMLKFQHSGGLS